MKPIHLSLAAIALTTAAHGQQLGRLHFPDSPDQVASNQITVDLTLFDDEQAGDTARLIPDEVLDPPVPGTDEPGTDEPGADEPGADEPGADEPGADEPGADEDPVRVSPLPNHAALDEAAGDPQRGVEVSVSPVAGEPGEVDPAQVSVKAPFPAKPLTPAPAGWILVASDDPDSAFERDVEIAGARLKLTIRPHLLVPDANGATTFAVVEPGFDRSLQYRQTETVGSLLGESIRRLKEDDSRMEDAISRLEQLLVSLPDPEP